MTMPRGAVARIFPSFFVPKKGDKRAIIRKRTQRDGYSSLLAQRAFNYVLIINIVEDASKRQHTTKNLETLLGITRCLSAHLTPTPSVPGVLGTCPRGRCNRLPGRRCPNCPCRRNAAHLYRAFARRK